MNHEVTHLVQFAKLEKKMEQKWRHEVEEHESHIRLKPLCFFAHIIMGYNFLIVSQQLEIIQSTHLVLCYSHTHTHTHTHKAFSIWMERNGNLNFHCFQTHLLFKILHVLWIFFAFLPKPRLDHFKFWNKIWQGFRVC